MISYLQDFRLSFIRVSRLSHDQLPKIFQITQRYVFSKAVKTARVNEWQRKRRKTDADWLTPTT